MSCIRHMCEHRTDCIPTIASSARRCGKGMMSVTVRKEEWMAGVDDGIAG